MATIRRRVWKSKTTYTAQIRVKGKPSISQTFDRKTDAKIWAQQTEADLRHAKITGGRRTVSEAIEHYRGVALGSLDAAHQVHRERHLAWWQERIGAVRLDHLGESHIREHLRSLTERKPATLNRYRSAISAVLSFIVGEEWLVKNPLQRVVS